MSDEQQETDKPDIPWGIAGPKTAEHRALARQRFLEGLVKFHAVSQACDYAGISRDTAYKWKEQDKKFSGDWDQAIARLHDIARASIFERAFYGTDAYIVSFGKVALDLDGNPLVEKKYSDSLAALYARTQLPEYREKQTIDLNVQLAEEAEKAKGDLLASLGAAVDEDSQAAP